MLNFLLKKSTLRGKVVEILVRDSSLLDTASPLDAVEDLLAFVHAALHEARYLPEELPREAIQLYEADLYVRMVREGGHGAYLAQGQAHPETMDAAMAGLKLIGCLPLVATLRDLLAWADTTPETGVPGNKGTLEALNARVLAVPMDTYANAMRRWLAQSTIVGSLPPKAWTEAVAQLTSKNPNHRSRMRAHAIAALNAGLTSDIVAVYRACVAGQRAQTRMFEVLGVTKGAPTAHPDRDRAWFDMSRDECQVWILRTNDNSHGTLYGLVTNERVFVCTKSPEDGSLQPLFERGLGAVHISQSLAAEFKPGRFAYDLVLRVTPEDPPAFLTFVQKDQTAQDLANETMAFGVTSQNGVQYTLVINQAKAIASASLLSWPAQETLTKTLASPF